MKDGKKLERQDPAQGPCNCPFCDGPLSPPPAFCRPCEKKFVKCPGCGGFVLEGSCVCTQCGASVS